MASTTHETSQYDERGFKQHTNCGPLCAEMLGGDCPGNGCVYAPDQAEIPWSDFDPRLAEREAELRGYLRAVRLWRLEYRRGYTLGFWSGVGTVLACMFILALIQWAVGS